jgi:pimeloyl-ACP methyl ester carboxylesterase
LHYDLNSENDANLSGGLDSFTGDFSASREPLRTQLFIGFVVSLLFVPAAFAKPPPENVCASPSQKIAEKGFVEIGGISQWVMIKRDKCANPTFLLQGEADYLTLPETSRRHFDSLSVPQKQFIMLPRTGHDPNHGRCAV